LRMNASVCSSSRRQRRSRQFWVQPLCSTHAASFHGHAKRKSPGSVQSSSHFQSSLA
jgi:hypothetical protein